MSIANVEGNSADPFAVELGVKLLIFKNENE
jgi:hypothetical protein